MASLRRAMRQPTPKAQLSKWRFARGVRMARRSDAIHLDLSARAARRRPALPRTPALV